MEESLRTIRLNRLIELLKSIRDLNWRIESPKVLSPIDDMIEMAYDSILLLKNAIEYEPQRRVWLNPDLIFREEKYDPKYSLGNLKSIKVTKTLPPLMAPEVSDNLSIILHFLHELRRLGQNPAFHELGLLPRIRSTASQQTKRVSNISPKPASKVQSKYSSKSRFFYKLRSKKS